jgi:hypothetical protein
MSAEARVRELVQAKLLGRTVDVVGFIDGLFALATGAGEIQCGLAPDERLRFRVADQVFEVELDAARGKLRMLCARLSVLCNRAVGGAVSPYGADVIIATTDRASERWAVRFINTPDQQQFTISLVDTQVPESGTKENVKSI